MKLVFGSLLIMHGAIHLIGFVKAFYTTEIDKQILGIPKFIGAAWLLVFILFVVTATSYFHNKKWFYLAFVAVLFSQILIITIWEEAKYGTIVNFIVLLISISAFGNNQFDKKVGKESAALFQNIVIDSTSIISENDISDLPKVVQNWMRNSGVIGAKYISSVRLKQKGYMKIKPNGKWMPFKANQYFNIDEPAFIWTARIDNNSIIHTLGRDKYNNGKSEMLIKLLGIIPVVNETENDKINFGTMQRFLSEICWFPSAALNDCVSWEYVSDTSAKAIFTYKSQSVTGVFSFNNEGNIISFETMRFFGGELNSKKEKWVIDVIDYRVFNGYTIPNICKVTWYLKEGKFKWLNLEIKEIEYNVFEPYK